MIVISYKKLKKNKFGFGMNKMEQIEEYFSTYGFFCKPMSQNTISNISKLLETNNMSISNDPETLYYYGLYFFTKENNKEMMEFLYMASTQNYHEASLEIAKYYLKNNNNNAITYFLLAENQGNNVAIKFLANQLKTEEYNKKLEIKIKQLTLYALNYEEQKKYDLMKSSLIDLINMEDTDALINFMIFNKNNFANLFNCLKIAITFNNNKIFYQIYTKLYQTKDLQIMLDKFYTIASLWVKCATYCESDFGMMKFFLEKGIENGCKDSMLKFAQYYRTKDYENMLKYYNMAIELGNRDAMYSLAHYYHLDNKYEEMLKYYMMAIELGCIQSMTNLGIFYGEQNNFDEMKKYLEMAIYYGDAKAMQFLASYYDDTEKNEGKMVYYLKLGIEKEDDFCMAMYGEYLIKKERKEEGKKLLEDSAKRGCEYATMLLRNLEKIE